MRSTFPSALVSRLLTCCFEGESLTCVSQLCRVDASEKTTRGGSCLLTQAALRKSLTVLEAVVLRGASDSPAVVVLKNTGWSALG